MTMGQGNDILDQLNDPVAPDVSPLVPVLDVELLAGDIVLVSGDSAIARAIKALTRSRGEEPTVANHVGIIVHPGKVRDALIGEALERVVVRPLMAYAGCERIKIIRAINLSDQERWIVANHVAAREGQKYGALKLLPQAIDGVLGWLSGEDTVLARRVSLFPNLPICSYLAGMAYREIGKDFGVPAMAANPDEIDDFGNTSGKYTTVLDWQVLQHA